MIKKNDNAFLFIVLICVGATVLPLPGLPYTHTRVLTFEEAQSK